MNDVSRLALDVRYYVVGVLLGIDILANAVLGGDHYTTISCRIGESIEAGGLWSRVPMPKLLREHFLSSVMTQPFSS